MAMLPDKGKTRDGQGTDKKDKGQIQKGRHTNKQCRYASLSVYTTQIAILIFLPALDGEIIQLHIAESTDEG